MNYYAFKTLFLISTLVLQQLSAQNTSQDSITIQITKNSTKKNINLIYVTTDSVQKYMAPDSTGSIQLLKNDVVDQVLNMDISGFRRASKSIKSKDMEKGPLIKIDVYPNWLFNMTSSFNVSQQAFGRYWQSGGINSVALSSKLILGLNYKKSIVNWESEADLTYGIIKQGDNQFIKNQDLIILNSKFGLEITRTLNGAFASDLRTHFHDGFTINSDGSRGELFSGFLSPAYINGGIGIDYQPREGFSLYLAPLNGKLTIVKDSSLRSNYLPANELENSIRTELGSYLKLNYKKNFNGYITLNSRLALFANYAEDNNLDLNTEHTLTCSISKYIKAVVEVQLLYDEDIQFTLIDSEGEPILDNNEQPQKGPRVQFREGFSLGFIYKM